MESPQWRINGKVLVLLCVVTAVLVVCGIRDTEEARFQLPDDVSDAGTEGIEIDLDNAPVPVKHDSSERGWTPVVNNGSGETFDNAVLEISISDSGDDESQMSMRDFPDEASCEVSDPSDPVDPECEERAAAAEDCHFPGEDNTDTYVSGQTVRCTKELTTGKNEYTIDLGLFDHELADEPASRDYPDARIHAELIIPDGKAAEASETVPLDRDPALDRVTIDGVPGTIPSDRKKPDGFTAQVTVENDTDEDFAVDRLEIGIEDVVELETSFAGCVAAEFGSELECDVALPAGESITVDLELYGADDTGILRDNCNWGKRSACIRSTSLGVRLWNAGEGGFLAVGEARTKVELVD